VIGSTWCARGLECFQHNGGKRWSWPACPFHFHFPLAKCFVSLTMSGGTTHGRVPEGSTVAPLASRASDGAHLPFSL
jgi:hypothetical protein